MIVAAAQLESFVKDEQAIISHPTALPRSAGTLLLRLQQAAWPMKQDVGLEFMISYSSDGRLFRELGRVPVVDEDFATLIKGEYRYTSDLPDVGKDGRFVQVDLLMRKDLNVAYALEVLDAAR